MDPLARRLIESVHQSASKFVLAVTGGGASVVGQLLSVAGSSHTILEAVIPYGEQALIDFLGVQPEKFCDARTSRDMATRARERGSWLAPGESVVGVGCTASLVSDRPKRGDHRFHVSVDSGCRIATHSLVLRKGNRDREGEEAVVVAAILNAIAEAAGVPGRVAVPLLEDETPEVDDGTVPDPVAALMKDQRKAVLISKDGQLRTASPTPPVVIPGAFNPLHRGHWELASVASRLLGKPAAFELSVANVDKPALTVAEARCRSRQFTWKGDVWLTHAPTFEEKAVLFPGAVFVVGADTAARIVDAHYYGNNEGRMIQALERIRAAGCRFLVAGRRDPAGRFLLAEDLDLPLSFHDLFRGIPADDFQMAVSSTELRRAASAQHQVDSFPQAD